MSRVSHVAAYDLAIDRLEVDGFIPLLSIDRKQVTLSWIARDRQRSSETGVTLQRTTLRETLAELGQRALAWCHEHEVDIRGS